MCKQLKFYFLLFKHDFEWLQKYPVKAKEMLERPTEEFKMPKTPARKKRGQQKKRGLTYDEGLIVFDKTATALFTF